MFVTKPHLGIPSTPHTDVNATPSTDLNAGPSAHLHTRSSSVSLSQSVTSPLTPNPETSGPPRILPAHHCLHSVLNILLLALFPTPCLFFNSTDLLAWSSPSSSLSCDILMSFAIRFTLSVYSNSSSAPASYQSDITKHICGPTLPCSNPFRELPLPTKSEQMHSADVKGPDLMLTHPSIVSLTPAAKHLRP